MDSHPYTMKAKDNFLANEYGLLPVKETPVIKPVARTVRQPPPVEDVRTPNHQSSVTLPNIVVDKGTFSLPKYALRADKSKEAKTKKLFTPIVSYMILSFLDGQRKPTRSKPDNQQAKIKACQEAFQLQCQRGTQGLLRHCESTVDRSALGRHIRGERQASKAQESRWDCYDR